MKDILHFSHANGFPGGSYRKLLAPLSDVYDVRVTDRFAHNPLYPVTDNWDKLAAELIGFFEKEYRQPVIAVGHSLGGLLSLMVAMRRPELIKALIMLDSPALTAFQSHSLRVAKWLGMVDRITPAGRTDGRRSFWSDRQEAFDYFSGKRLMKDFDKECLWDYVNAGTENIDGGVKLRFAPETEMKIYRTIPHNIRITKSLPMPGCALGGTESKVFRRVNGALMHSRLGMTVRWLPGTHMFPLEHPQKTAQAIQQWLEVLV